MYYIVVYYIILYSDGRPSRFSLRRSAAERESETGRLAWPLQTKTAIRIHKHLQVTDSLRGSSVNIGTIQRILAWPLCKDDTHTQIEKCRDVLNKSVSK